MSKREKIIILVMVAAAVFAALNFMGMFDSKKAARQSGVNVEDLDNYISMISGQILQKTLSPTEIYTMELAQDNWRGNPFRLPPVEESADDSVNLDETDYSAVYQYIYSGYVKAGSRTFGIINGLEHKVGDKVGDMGFRVGRITPTKVVVIKTGLEITLNLSNSITPEATMEEGL